jgi:hypothetical protein
MGITLDELGLTKEQLQEMVVEKISNDLLIDEEGFYSAFHREAKSRIEKQIESSINSLCERFVMPNVNEMVESLSLQATNRWGEKKGEALTFTEYLVHRAEKWMSEMVDHSGKDKQAGGHGWRARQTRLAHMIHEHLYHRISRVMAEAIGDANAQLGEAIVETVKVQLEDIKRRLSVKVESK